MVLTTRPPGAPGTGGVGPPAPAPAPSELRALVAEIRALLGTAAGARPLPPLPELAGAGAERVLGRWFRTALDSGGLASAALATIVDDALRKLLASAAEAGTDTGPLEAARDAALRLLAAAQGPESIGAAGPGTPAAGADRALVLGILAAELTSGVAHALGPEAVTAPAPVAAADPGAAAEALVAWLRAAAARAGAAPALVERTVTAAIARALDFAARAGADPAGRAVLETVGTLIVRGLVGGAGGTAPLLLYRPDVPPRPAATGPRARGADPGVRVLPIGEDQRRAGRARRRAAAARGSAGEAGEEPMADNPTEGPMQCVRRAVDALLAGDSAAFTAQWVYPACFWIDGHWLGCEDETALAALQARMLRGRREQGLTGGRILLLRVDPVSETVALVHAVVSEERADPGGGSEVEWLYTAVRSAAGWRVAVAAAP